MLYLIRSYGPDNTAVLKLGYTEHLENKLRKRGFMYPSLFSLKILIIEMRYIENRRVLIITNKKFRLFIFSGDYFLYLNEEGKPVIEQRDEDHDEFRYSSFCVFSKEACDIIAKVLRNRGISYQIILEEGKTDIPWFYPHKFSDYFLSNRYRICFPSPRRFSILKSVLNLLREQYRFMTYCYKDKNYVELSSLVAHYEMFTVIV